MKVCKSYNSLVQTPVWLRPTRKTVDMYAIAVPQLQSEQSSPKSFLPLNDTLTVLVALLLNKIWLEGIVDTTAGVRQLVATVKWVSVGPHTAGQLEYYSINRRELKLPIFIYHKYLRLSTIIQTSHTNFPNHGAGVSRQELKRRISTWERL